MIDRSIDRSSSLQSRSVGNPLTASIPVRWTVKSRAELFDAPAQGGGSRSSAVVHSCNGELSFCELSCNFLKCSHSLLSPLN
jgi:hypothetical protein